MVQHFSRESTGSVSQAARALLYARTSLAALGSSGTVKIGSFGTDKFPVPLPVVGAVVRQREADVAPCGTASERRARRRSGADRNRAQSDAARFG